jgi:NTP pyrophosphatase (non-canonical NTP hydrolase)
MKLDDYQRQTRTTDQNPRSTPDSADPSAPHKAEVIPLLGLVGEVGSLLGEYKKLLRDGETHRRFKEEVAEELGDILWYVANVATKFDLSLGEIAAQNLRKVNERWTTPTDRGPLPDDDQEPSAQLPRKFSYRFEHRGEDQRLVLFDVVTNTQVGDPLSDNAYEDDGYRFHDVMHLTFAAMLGWSPVHRKLLRKAKVIENRKPDSKDSAEDGGRGQVIDEAIVLAAYAYAADRDLLKNATSIDWDLLRHIKKLTSGVEVANRTTKEWNDALLRGFEMWRLLRAGNGGIITGDLRARTIEFSPRQHEP